MNNFLKLIILLFIFIISYFIYARFHSNIEIPKFEYKTIDNLIFSNNDIVNSEKKIVFIYFSCKCDDCKELINNIENYKNLQKQSQIILITTEKDVDVIKKFVNCKELNKLKIPVLIDENNNFPSDFGLGISIDLPKILVFDKNKSLLKDVNSIEKLRIITNN
jgi:thiol-disulfide isomerase/thioredoxin